jgi:hypothetical protein
VVYSQSLSAVSTPSQSHAPLGLEFDLGFSYRSDDGFLAWTSYGFLFPLVGLGYPPGTLGSTSLADAHALRIGLAVKF